MNLKKLIGALTLTVLATHLTVAQAKDASKSKAKETPKKATEQKLQTLKKASGQVKWTGFGVGKSHSGTIDVKSGEVSLSDNKLTSAQFVLDMKTLKTADSDRLQAHLMSEDFFDVTKFPEAKFQSTLVQALPNEPSKYEVTGNLTIKDKMAPITFTVDVTQKDKKYEAKGSTEILDRTKYGIKYNSKQFASAEKLGNKLIEDNIKLELDVTVQ